MLTRRAVLAVGGLSLTGAVTGCSVDSLRPAAPEATVDEDTQLVARMRIALLRARDMAAGTPFAALHAAQLAALEGPTATSAPTPPSAAATAPPASADQVRASETALQQRLLRACQHARSGQLAAVFASMAAGIAQALA